MYQERYEEKEFFTPVEDNAPAFKVQSLLHTTKVFSTYKEALNCRNKWLAENDFDFVTVLAHTDSGWEELEITDEE